MNRKATFLKLMSWFFWLGVVSFVVIPKVMAEEFPLTQAQFEELVAEFVPKVNLFNEVWKQDPEAVFFGGTSRDFLYWLKGEIIEAHKQGKLDEKLRQLRLLPNIAVRDFISGDSDGDVVTGKHINLTGGMFGLKKIDPISAVRLNPNTYLGRSEIDQGYIAAEKIRIGRNGLFKDGMFGDGIREILFGPLTAKFSPKEVFDETYWAKEGYNHRVHLALRFIRILAMHYYYSHGKGLPDRKELLPIPPELEKEVRTIIQEAMTDPELARLLQNEKFRMRFNETVQKAFRSYTNPTAARMLYEYFGADALIAAHHPRLEPINQYLFAAYRDPEIINKHFEEYRIEGDKFFTPVSVCFPDGKLYHGTPKEEYFRNILLEGIYPSRGGSAGRGLYGSDKDNLVLPLEYAKSEERLVALEIKNEARIVDITQGLGQMVFNAFQKKRPGELSVQIEAFADYFGADIVRYPYKSRAYIVKNSTILGKPEGVKRQVLPFSALLDKAREVHTKEKFVNLLNTMSLNKLADREVIILSRETPYYQSDVGEISHLDELEKLIQLLKASQVEKNILAQLVSGVPLEKMARTIQSREDLKLFYSILGAANLDSDQKVNRLMEVPFMKPLLGAVSHPESFEKLKKVLEFLDVSDWETVEILAQSEIVEAKEVVEHYLDYRSITGKRGRMSVADLVAEALVLAQFAKDGGSGNSPYKEEAKRIFYEWINSYGAFKRWAFPEDQHPLIEILDRMSRENPHFGEWMVRELRQQQSAYNGHRKGMGWNLLSGRWLFHKPQGKYNVDTKFGFFTGLIFLTAGLGGLLSAYSNPGLLLPAAIFIPTGSFFLYASRIYPYLMDNRREILNRYQDTGLDSAQLQDMIQFFEKGMRRQSKASRPGLVKRVVSGCRQGFQELIGGM